MFLEDLEEELSNVLPGTFQIKKNAKGNLVIHTSLTVDDNDYIKDINDDEKDDEDDEEFMNIDSYEEDEDVEEDY